MSSFTAAASGAEGSGPMRSSAMKKRYVCWTAFQRRSQNRRKEKILTAIQNPSRIAK